MLFCYYIHVYQKAYFYEKKKPQPIFYILNPLELTGLVFHLINDIINYSLPNSSMLYSCLLVPHFHNLPNKTKALILTSVVIFVFSIMYALNNRHTFYAIRFRQDQQKYFVSQSLLSS